MTAYNNRHIFDKLDNIAQIEPSEDCLKNAKTRVEQWIESQRKTHIQEDKAKGVSGENSSAVKY